MTIHSNRNWKKLVGSALLLTATLSLPAVALAAPAPDQRYRNDNNRRGNFYLDGTLFDRGRGGCQLVRDHQGRVYPIVGPGSRGLQVGEHVNLWGQMDSSTVCGNAFKAEVVDKVYRDGSHNRVVYDRRNDGYFDPDAYYSDRGRYDRDRRNGRYDRDDDNNRRLVSVEGRINDNRRSCPTLRTNEGDTYNLTGDLRSYNRGDKVRVIGFLDGNRSACGGGPAIEVREINRGR
jgi:hypothetical protein